MDKIVLDRRVDLWHASANGDPAYWGIGASISQAIGDLILSWPSHFGIEIAVTAHTKPSPTALPSSL